MGTIRPNAEPAATAVQGGDIFLIDGVTGVRALAASVVPIRDANANVAINNIVEGFTTVTTAAGTTTLTVASTAQQFFTGTTTQTVLLPVTSTLALGQRFIFDNDSTGAVTVQSSGANNVLILAPGTRAFIDCISLTGTTAASWDVAYLGTVVASGKALTVSNSLTLAGTDGKTLTVDNNLELAGTDGTKMTFPSTNATIARTDAGQTFTGTQNLASLTASSAVATDGSKNLVSVTNTGSGNNVLATTPTMNQANLVGTTTNDNAAAGSVGEYISSTVVQGSAVALTTATPANVTSISLTAGDWDVWGSIAIVPASTVTIFEGWINTTSASVPTLPGNGAMTLLQVAFTSATQQILPVGRQRLSLASTTTVFLSASITFASTCSAYGFIGARRLR